MFIFLSSLNIYQKSILIVQYDQDFHYPENITLDRIFEIVFLTMSNILIYVKILNKYLSKLFLFLENTKQ